MIQEEKNVECPICLSELNPGEPTEKCPHCLYEFHRSCLTQSLFTPGNPTTCPCCRGNMNDLRDALRNAQNTQPIQPAILNNNINNNDLRDDDDDNALNNDYGSTCGCS